MMQVPHGFELIDCPGCGDGGWSIIHEGTDLILGHGPVRIVRCGQCGLHYTNPRPDAGHISEYYPSDYEPHESSPENGRLPGGVRGLILRSAYGAPALRPRGWRRAAAAAAAVVKRPRSVGFGVAWHGRGRLLDFGCGGGKFLKRMAELGWDVTGVDFSHAAVERVRAAGLRAVAGTLPHPDLPAGGFDVITMRHSLEHLPAPRPVLAAARELLAAGGLLVVQVPNYASWEVDYFGDASPRLDLPRHLLHFTPTTLADLLRTSGYELLDLHQTCRPNWLRKAAEQAARHPERPRRAADVLFRSIAICRIAALLCRLGGRGNEIIAAAQMGKDRP